MLEFNLHEMKVGSRFYILLPKLNRIQVQILENRLKTEGFTVQGDSLLTARSKYFDIHINPSGLCWSSSDPSDSVAPVIPKILATPKSAIPLEELKRLYFSIEPSGSSYIVRFESRMENGPLWKLLRSTNQCGLAPDETAVLDFLLESAEGRCDALTDFPTPAGHKRVIGGRTYFDSHLDVSEFRSTLRSVEARSTRNSYLPSRGPLRLTNAPSERRFSDLFESLGEWCYLTPS